MGDTGETVGDTGEMVGATGETVGDTGEIVGDTGDTVEVEQKQLQAVSINKALALLLFESTYMHQLPIYSYFHLFNYPSPAP